MCIYILHTWVYTLHTSICVYTLSTQGCTLSTHLHCTCIHTVFLCKTPEWRQTINNLLCRSHLVGHMSHLVGHMSHLVGHTYQVTPVRSHLSGHTYQVTHGRSHLAGHTYQVKHTRSNLAGQTWQVTPTRSHLPGHTWQVKHGRVSHITNTHIHKDTGLKSLPSHSSYLPEAFSYVDCV